MRILTMSLLSVAALALSACVGGHSPSARFFQLQATPPLAHAGEKLNPAVFIAVNPVNLESYLRKPQVALRVQPHEVKYDEFNRWAEPLERNITRVIAENLRAALSTDHVAIITQGFATKNTITLVTAVKQFERQPDGSVLLNADWQLVRNAKTNAAALGTATWTVPATGNSMEDLAAAQSKLLGDLSARIAADILALAETGNGPQVRP